MFLSMRSALKINYYNLVSYSVVKNLPANEGDAGLVPGSGRSPGRGNSYHSCIHAWRIPWTEDPGGLQSMGLQRVRHDLVTETITKPNGKSRENCLKRNSTLLNVYLFFKKKKKERDITLPTKVHLVKAMIFPVVMYGCESWTIKKAEC